MEPSEEVKARNLFRRKIVFIITVTNSRKISPTLINFSTYFYYSLNYATGKCNYRTQEVGTAQNETGRHIPSHITDLLCCE